MSRRPQLSRQVPAESAKKFADWCEREGHVNGGDKGRLAEQALVEYLPPDYRPERFCDDLDELESDLRADLDAVGHLDADSSSNATPTSTTGDETVKITYRIAEDVQDSLKQYVYDQEGKVRGVVGEYVAAALDEYRDGGQVARVRRYYEQLRESADMISEDRVGAVVRTLKNNTGERNYYNIEEIKLAVDEALDTHSDDVRNDFADRAIERLGFVAVETSEGVYATPERAEQMVQEHQTGSDVDWYSMDRADRVEHLIKAVKARSQQTKAGAGVDYNQVRDEIFGGHPSNDYCYELMELAGKEPGYVYGKHNGKLLLRYTCDNDELAAKSTEEWLDDAMSLVREFCDDAGVEPAQVRKPVLDNRIVRAKYPEEYDEEIGPSERAMRAVTENDRSRVLAGLSGSGDQGEAEVEYEAQQELSRLTSEAEPVTDGGHW